LIEHADLFDRPLYHLIPDRDPFPDYLRAADRVPDAVRLLEPAAG
jgi:hypothetical protein